MRTIETLWADFRIVMALCATTYEEVYATLLKSGYPHDVWSFLLQEEVEEKHFQAVADTLGINTVYLESFFEEDYDKKEYLHMLRFVKAQNISVMRTLASSIAKMHEDLKKLVGPHLNHFSFYEDEISKNLSVMSREFPLKEILPAYYLAWFWHKDNIVLFGILQNNQTFMRKSRDFVEKEKYPFSLNAFSKFKEYIKKHSKEITKPMY